MLFWFVYWWKTIVQVVHLLILNDRRFYSILMMICMEKREKIAYLDLGRNMDPSMKTEPESNMYQHVDSSPVLERKRNCRIRSHEPST